MLTKSQLSKARLSTGGLCSRLNDFAPHVALATAIVALISSLTFGIRHKQDTAAAIAEYRSEDESLTLFRMTMLAKGVQAIDWKVERILDGDVEVKDAQIRRPSVQIFASSPAGTSAGSGTVVAVDGKKSYIITAYHVIDGAGDLTVRDSAKPGLVYPATFAVADIASDIAVIVVDAELPFVATFIRPDEIKQLEVLRPCYTFGFAAGRHPGHFSGGYICDASASGRMSASVTFGNSGGGVYIKTRGGHYRLVGVVNKIALVSFNGQPVPVFHMAFFTGPDKIVELLESAGVGHVTRGN